MRTRILLEQNEDGSWKVEPYIVVQHERELTTDELASFRELAGIVTLLVTRSAKPLEASCPACRMEWIGTAPPPFCPNCGGRLLAGALT